MRLFGNPDLDIKLQMSRLLLLLLPLLLMMMMLMMMVMTVMLMMNLDQSASLELFDSLYNAILLLCLLAAFACSLASLHGAPLSFCVLLAHAGRVWAHVCSWLCLAPCRQVKVSS